MPAPPDPAPGRAPPPADWQRRGPLWLGWPHLQEEWAVPLAAVRAEIAALARLAAPLRPVRIAAGTQGSAAAAEDAFAADAPRIQVCRLPLGDIWLRDTGPLVLGSGPEGGRGAGFCFALARFNGWGGKYEMPGDQDTAAALVRAVAADAPPPDRLPFVLEGGAIDPDGSGAVLTTRECLLHENRNGWSQAEAEAALRALGLRRVIWLERGLSGDHTDGHVDNIARWLAPGLAALAGSWGEADPSGPAISAAGRALEEAGVSVLRLPSPGPVRGAEGGALPASHANFIHLGDAVILPRYSVGAGDDAAEALRAAGLEAPGGGPVQILQSPAAAILEGGGSLHCMSWEAPS